MANTVGLIFDLKKLDWLNGHYIRSLTPEELGTRIVAFARDSGQWPDPSPADADLLVRATPLIQERLVLLGEALPKLEFLFAGDADRRSPRTPSRPRRGRRRCPGRRDRGPERGAGVHRRADPGGRCARRSWTGWG